jgi:hypothetical protein
MNNTEMLGDFWALPGDSSMDTRVSGMPSPEDSEDSPGDGGLAGGVDCEMDAAAASLRITAAPMAPSFAEPQGPSDRHSALAQPPLLPDVSQTLRSLIPSAAHAVSAGRRAAATGKARDAHAGAAAAASAGARAHAAVAAQPTDWEACPMAEDSLQRVSSSPIFFGSCIQAGSPGSGYSTGVAGGHDLHAAGASGEWGRGDAASRGAAAAEARRSSAAVASCPPAMYLPSSSAMCPDATARRGLPACHRPCSPPPSVPPPQRILVSMEARGWGGVREGERERPLLLAPPLRRLEAARNAAAPPPPPPLADPAPRLEAARNAAAPPPPPDPAPLSHGASQASLNPKAPQSGKGVRREGDKLGWGQRRAAAGRVPKAEPGSGWGVTGGWDGRVIKLGVAAGEGEWSRVEEAVLATCHEFVGACRPAPRASAVVAGGMSHAGV